MFYGVTDLIFAQRLNKLTSVGGQGFNFHNAQGLSFSVNKQTIIMWDLLAVRDPLHNLLI